jgi:hypothetical protein
MVAIIGVSVLIFLFYFLASFNTSDAKTRFVFIGLFVLSTFVLRFLMRPELNKDYFGYFDLFDFKLPENVLSAVLGEPYLKILYVFFNLFTDDKSIVFTCIYWFNLLFSNAFFIWVVTRTDVQMWKKIILFSFFYFLFAFVLIRNSPVYILFAMYFYYSFRKENFNWILVTPFIHISSIAVLITYFHKRQNYYTLFLVFSVVVAVLLVLVLPKVSNSFALELTLSKVSTYSAEMDVVSVFHKVYFVFISGVVLITAFVYKKQMIHPIISTTILLYYISFTVNPIVGFRFAPYLLFSILLFNYTGTYHRQFTKIFNLISFLMLPYFIYTLIDTHYL